MFKNIILYLLYVMVSAFGLYQVKAAGSHIPNLAFAVGLLAYGAGFVIWIIILRLNPLSVAFPIAASSLIIATQLVGYLALREGFNYNKMLGTILILAGIFVFYLESRRA